jgi:hypothetical protein
MTPAAEEAADAEEEEAALAAATVAAAAALPAVAVEWLAILADLHNVKVFIMLIKGSHN